MSRSADWKDILLENARSRGIVLVDDDIRTMRGTSSDSSLAQWVNNNLRLKDVLSLEELHMSKQARGKKGLNKDGLVASAARLCIVDDLQQTILALENSTRAIDEQTRVVETQQKFLDNVRSRQQAPEDRSSRQQRHQIQKLAAETQRIELINDDKYSELGSRLHDEQVRFEQEAKAGSGIILERLNTDDRAIDQLLRSLAEANPVFDVQRELSRTELLLLSLSKTRTETIKDRLDRVYLETLNGAQQSGTQEKLNAEKMTSKLLKDVRSLYTEVEYVMTMLVGTERGNDLRLQIRMIAQSQDDEANFIRMKMVSKIFKLRQKLDAFDEKFKGLLSQRFLHLKMMHHLNMVRSIDLQRHQRYEDEHQEGNGQAFKDLRRHVDAKGGSSPETKLPCDVDTCEKVTGQIREKLQRAAHDRRSQVRLFLGSPGSAMSDIHSQLEDFDQRLAKAKYKLEQYALILQH